MDKQFSSVAVEVEGRKFVCGGHIDTEHLVELDSVRLVPSWSSTESIDVTDILDQGVYDEVTEAVTESFAEGVV